MNTTTHYPQLQGLVTRKTTGHYLVCSGSRSIDCELSPRLRKMLIYPSADPSSLSRIVREVRDIQVIDPVAVGDQVNYLDTGSGGLIVEVLPRRSRLSRCEATGPHKSHPREQVIVANADLVLAVISAAQPAPTWNLLDRYLVSAESLQLPSLVVITKQDLAGTSEADLLDEADLYRRIGYQVILTSTVSGAGLSELRQALDGRLSVLVGKSGVGKTSLLNALQPGLGALVREVSSKTDKGRHTTTHIEMISLDGNGSAVVDTPGMREFGLWLADEEDLALYFPEMCSLVGKCRFGLDCAHVNEPGCAIRLAVENGEIAPSRYTSMLKLSSRE